MSSLNRRRFVKSTAAAGAAPLIIGTKSSAKVRGANDRLRIAVAGLNGRGGSHLGGLGGIKGVEIAYVADPDSGARDRRLNEVRSRGHKNCKAVVDIREALEDPEVDAISVATPNHWHSLMTIWAAQAGKHVYVEKPMSHDVEEGRVAVAAQKKYGVVIQHGTQRRSDKNIAALHEMIKAGTWGKLKIAYGYCCKPRGGIGTKGIASPPENLDWDIWKGPAVIDDYHANYVHYNWHWFWKTGNGDLNNQGTHQLDVARWAIDDNQTHPVRAMAIGGRFQWNDQGEPPNPMLGIAQYPNGQYCFFNVRNVNYNGYQRQVKNEYYFEDGGRIMSDTNPHYFKPGSDKGEKIQLSGGDVTPGGCWNSFVTACRENKPEMANGDVMDAHYGCVVGHLMNNSYRLGKKVPFNKKAGTFGDNKDAGEHFGILHDVMEKGCKIPVDKEHYTVGPWLTFDPKTERHTGEFAAEANALLKDPNNKGFEIPDASKV